MTAGSARGCHGVRLPGPALSFSHSSHQQLPQTAIAGELPADHFADDCTACHGTSELASSATYDHST
jgi:hypothetical protein